jgi:protein-tyrosine phosphatase
MSVRHMTTSKLILFKDGVELPAQQDQRIEGVRSNLSGLKDVAINTTNCVLFLCTGNYYRSRYAEELFNFYAKNRGLPWQAFSRGLAEKGSPENVGPMSRFALEALQANAIEPQGALRYPQPCTLADFDRAELVIALKEAEHRPLVERRFPEVASRITYWHVDDIDFAAPAIALPMIYSYVQNLIAKRLAAEEL